MDTKTTTHFIVRMTNTKFRNISSIVTYTQTSEQAEDIISQLPTYIDCTNIKFTVEELQTDGEQFTKLDDYVLHVWFDKTAPKSGPYRLVLLFKPDTGDYYYRELDEELAFFSFPLAEINCLSDSDTYQNLLARCRRIMSHLSKLEQHARIETILKELNTSTKIALS